MTERKKKLNNNINHRETSNSCPDYKQCHEYKHCSGCQLQNLSYPEQLLLKQRIVVGNIGKYCEVEDIIGMDNPLHYRNKLQAAFKLTPNKRIISGVYQSSTGGIVNADGCMIEDKRSEKIVKAIKSLMPKYKMLPFDSYSHKGFLRHVLVRRGFKTGEIMVVLVSGTPIFPKADEFAKELVSMFPDIKTIVHTVNTNSAKMMLGGRQKVLYGKGYIIDELCGLKFKISPHSFYQVNPVQTEKLYAKAIEAAELSGEETVLDAFCGIGTIGLIAAKKAKHVVGVEQVSDAVKDAVENAKLNGIKNAYFNCADAGEFLESAANEGESADIAFLDPARAGCDRRFLESLIKLAPKKIVYISCNVETQARDLAVLCSGEYKAVFAQPFDLFPFTKHVENIVLLTKKHGK